MSGLRRGGMWAAAAIGAFVLFLVVVALAGVIYRAVNPADTQKSHGIGTPTPVPTATRSRLLWAVRVSGGSMPSPQIVGQHVTVRWTVRNTGRYIPDLTMWFQGLGSWVIDDEFSNCGNELSPKTLDVFGNGNAFDFGSLEHGRSCHPVLQLTPKTAGNHTLSFDTYTTTLDGAPDHNISDASYSVSVAIDPY